MIHRGKGRRRPGAVAALLAVISAPLAGCLPPRNASGEPLEPIPTYVKSVRIDPRTLEPIEDEAATGAAPRGGADAPSE